MNKLKKSQVLLFFVLLLILAIIPLPSSLRPTYLYFISNLIVIALSAEAGLFSISFMPVEDTKHSPPIIHNFMIPSEASSQKMEPSIPSEHAVEKSEPAERVVSVIKVQKGPSSKASLFFTGNGEDRKHSTPSELAVEKSESAERVVSVIKVQKGPSSKASLFFTGNGEDRKHSIPSELAVESEKSELAERVVSVIKVQKGLSSKASLFFIGNDEADEEEMTDEESEAEEEEIEIEIEGVTEQELFAKAEVFIGNFYKQLKMQREEPWISQKAY